MNQVCRRSIISLFVLMLLTSIVQATTIIQQPLQTLSQNAELIFEGTVVGIQSERNGKRIYTWVSFEINDVIKGNYTDDRIELRYLGGTVADMRSEIAEMELPEIGETGIYLVESISSQPVHPLLGWGQGHFLIKQTSNSSRSKVYNSQGIAVVGLDVPSKNQATKINSHTAAGVKLGSRFSNNNLASDAMDMKEFKMQLKAWKE